MCMYVCVCVFVGLCVCVCLYACLCVLVCVSVVVPASLTLYLLSLLPLFARPRMVRACARARVCSVTLLCARVCVCVCAYVRMRIAAFVHLCFLALPNMKCNRNNKHTRMCRRRRDVPPPPLLGPLRLAASSHPTTIDTCSRCGKPDGR